MRETSRLVIELPINIKVAFKVACDRKNVAMSDVVRNLVLEWVKKNGEPMAQASQLIG
mgnify:CR=1 FL=1